MRAGAVFVAAVALLTAVGHPAVQRQARAREAGVGSEAVERARAHFGRGVELYRLGVYDAALAEFSRAYDSAPNYRVLYNLAQVQAQRHQYAEALTLLTRYLEAGGDRIGKQRQRDVDEQLLQLEGLVARLSVTLDVQGERSKGTQARLFVDGVMRGELDERAPILLDAGVHHVRVSLEGFHGQPQQITLTGGEAVEVRMSMREDSKPSVAPPPLPPPLALAPVYTPAPSPTWLWVGLGATGALAGATATLALLANSANRQFERQFSIYPANRELIDAERDRARRLALATDIVGVAALFATGLTTYAYYATRPSEPRHEEPRIRLLADPAGGRAELSWSGRF